MSPPSDSERAGIVQKTGNQIADKGMCLPDGLQRRCRKGAGAQERPAKRHKMPGMANIRADAKKAMLEAAAYHGRPADLLSVNLL